MPERTVIIATRKSRLARCQAALAERALIDSDPSVVSAILALSTTGDRESDWSLEQKGGKGLFTKEIEDALIQGKADLAIHSAKDLPTELPDGLVIAAYLPREDVRDVLILRKGVEIPERIATGSPRRRAQLRRLFPQAQFQEIRGNVETRLRKISEGEADATILASAGLKRLGVEAPIGIVFRELPLNEMIPACGQAAIALQCREEDAGAFSCLNDPATMNAVSAERAFLSALGGGCHTAFAGFSDGHSTFLAFHEKYGRRKISLTMDAMSAPSAFFSEAFKDWIEK